VVIFGQYNGEIFVVAGSLGAQSATQWIRETNLDQSEAVNLNKKLAGLLESQGFGGVWQQFWANLTKIRSLSPNSLNGTELSQLRSAALSAIQNIPDQLSQPITAPAKEGQRLVNQMQSAMPVVTQRAQEATKSLVSLFAKRVSVGVSVFSISLTELKGKWARLWFQDWKRYFVPLFLSIPAVTVRHKFNIKTTSSGWRRYVLPALLAYRCSSLQR
jgi:hypothetical protein